jgi:hypothetical protein
MFNPHIYTSVGRFFTGFSYEEPLVPVIKNELKPIGLSPPPKKVDYSM